MISDQVSKLIGDQFNRHSNVNGKTGPKWLIHRLPINLLIIIEYHNMSSLQQRVAYALLLLLQTPRELVIL